ncbi:MAG TPA: hypothetical protein VLZ12_02835 [Verrucomicrobiae bacterium]|nr:hypothetical protein [Verrucomicrobiae bacterium]
MAFWSKRKSPVDRAVADVEERIAALQRQMRELEAGDAGSLVSTRGQSVTGTLTKAVKEMLTPPTKKMSTPSRHGRRDLFDVPTEPLKDLEAEPITYAHTTEQDLFSPPRSQIDCSTSPQDKLAHYLSAGSIKSYKPLKHVQRQTRNRFFMWVGLSLVALWFIYAVVR